MKSVESIMDVRLSKPGRLLLTNVLFPLGVLLGCGNLARVLKLQNTFLFFDEPTPTSIATSTYELGGNEAFELSQSEIQLDKRFQSRSSLEILSPSSGLPFQPVIDILSIGSLTRALYQKGQEVSFRQHASVRHFVRVDESFDSDPTCHINLTLSDIDKVKSYCDYKNPNVPSQAARLARQFLFKPESNPGWMCAQKRPIDALYKVLADHGKSLPDYLFIIDDDTYLNMNLILKTLGENFRPDQPHKLTGCRFVYPRSIRFDFPYGGFGSILSKPVLENLMRPVRCDSDDDNFSKLSCRRLAQNLMGEKAYFENGISLLELMYRFTKENRFGDVDNWKNSGYCFHSDHTIGYFLGFYPVSVPEDEMDPTNPERLRRQFAYKNLTPSQGECGYEKRRCNPRKAAVCHYMKPQQMLHLWRIQTHPKYFESNEPGGQKHSLRRKSQASLGNKKVGLMGR